MSDERSSRDPRRTNARIVGVVLLAVAALAHAACDGSDGPRTELAEARARWEARGPADYDLVLERICFCGFEARGPVRIEVRDGVIVSRTYVDTGMAVGQDLATFFPDVDGLFAFLEDAFGREARSIEAEYDPVLGFPTRSFVDYRENIADEEQGHRVIALEIVQAGGEAS